METLRKVLSRGDAVLLGFAMALDFSGNIGAKALHRSVQGNAAVRKNDWQNLSSDWGRVGDYFRAVLRNDDAR